jgi:hypothetical protein
MPGLSLGLITCCCQWLLGGVTFPKIQDQACSSLSVGAAASLHYLLWAGHASR